MGEDISKKISISVEAQTDDFTKNVGDLNKIIDGLLAQQKLLDAAGQQNSNTFDSITSKLEAFQKKIQEVSKQADTTTNGLNSLGTAAKNNDAILSSLAKTAENGSSKLKALGTSINSLGQSFTQQKKYTTESKNALEGYTANAKKGMSSANELTNSLQQQATVVTQNKTAFNVHNATLKHLKTSFDEIKDVSGIFGPSLKEAAEGFNTLKSGLSLVKDGLNGVGDAIKADGFGFLLEILQKIFDYFINTTQGSNMLKGAISAIGVVVNKVENFFHLFMDSIIKAFSHPIDALKSLGKLIEQNLINRFKAFGVILDGIIHLDFKKITNGAVQAFTGVTDATDKIGTAFTNVKNGIQDTTNQIVNAYKDGYQQAGNNVDDHEDKVKKSLERQTGYYNKLSKKVKKVYDEQDNQGSLDRPPETLSATGSKVSITPTKPMLGDSVIKNANILQNETNNKSVATQKTALQQVEDYAKQSAGKIADNALTTLSNSIKRQSELKIATLEKDKASELSNSSLTSAQKLAIEQKYRQQEAQVKAKAFKEEQEASIAQAVINGAIAITKAEAQTGVLGALVIPGIIAETAVQVAKIASQKAPAYAKGGLHYNSDGRGGLLPGYSKTDNTNAFLRSGEGIVVSEAMQTPWARNLVSAINVGFGGRDFSLSNPGKGYAVGGIFTDGGDANRYYNQPVNDQKNLANTIAYQMINNFPPVYVDVKDVNNQQNILAQTINRVNL